MTCQEEQWEIAWKVIVDDAARLGLSANDVVDAWKIGLVAYKQALSQNTVELKSSPNNYVNETILEFLKEAEG